MENSTPDECTNYDLLIVAIHIVHKTYVLDGTSEKINPLEVGIHSQKH